MRPPPTGGRLPAAPLVVPLLLALLAALFFWRLTILGEALYWGTPLLQFFPWRTLAVQEYLSGRAPLWNPYAGFGAPLAANFQSAVFYPLNAVYFLLPVERAMTATVVLHVFLAGWFTYGLGRMLALSRSGALVSAVTFMFSGYLVARAGFLSITATVAWLPALLLALEGCLRTSPQPGGSRLLWIVAVAVATGMLLLAGHIQLAYYSLVAATLYLGYRLWSEDSSSRGPLGLSLFARGRRAIGHGGLALAGVALGVALAGVQLLPSWEMARESVRQGGAAYDFATGYSLWPGQLLGALAPNFFGSQANGDWWGPGAHWEGVIYLGALPLLLALLGLRHGQDRRRWFWLALALAALFLATGRYNPVFPALFERLPGLGLFQAPARFSLWYTLAGAMLAGLGWDALHAGGAARGRRLGLWATALALGMLLAALAFVLSGFDRAFQSTAATAVAAAGGWLLAAGALLWARPRAAPTWWRVGALSLVAVDLFVFGSGLNPTTDARLYAGSAPPSVAALREAASGGRIYTAEAVYKEGQERYFSFKRFSPTDWRELWQLREALMPNLATLERLPEAYNYDPLRLERPQRLQRAAEALDLPAGQAGLPPHILDLMGVRFILSYGDLAGPNRRLWGNSGPIAVYRGESPLPRAYVAPWPAPAAGPDEALALLTVAGFDPRREAVVEAPPGAFPIAGAAAGEARMVEDQPQRVAVEVSSSGGVLVLADAYYPGWRASLDGQEAPIWPANVAFRAVALPPGDHRVEFWYDPPSFRIGLALSGLALGTLIAMAGLGLRARLPTR